MYPHWKQDNFFKPSQSCTFAQSKHETMEKEESTHKIIGQIIKEHVKALGLSDVQFGEMIHCQRANVGKIYKRASIDSALLGTISRALNHNFFIDIADNILLSGVDDEEAQSEVYNRMAVSQFVEVVPRILRRFGYAPSIFFGRPIEIPEEIDLPDYYIGELNTTFTVGKLLSEKSNCKMNEVANVTRYRDTVNGITADLWQFHDTPQALLDVALVYRTEEEWEEVLRWIMNHFFRQYHLVAPPRDEEMHKIEIIKLCDNATKIINNIKLRNND